MDPRLLRRGKSRKKINATFWSLQLTWVTSGQFWHKMIYLAVKNPAKLAYQWAMKKIHKINWLVNYRSKFSKTSNRGDRS